MNLSEMNEAQLVSAFFMLKNKYEAEDAECKAKLGDIRAKIDRVEGMLLRKFQETGVDLLRTAEGSVFKGTRTSVSAADPDAFVEFVKSNGEWSLADIRPSKKGIEQYVEAKEELPPGINWSEENVVKFRRSN